MSKTAEQKALEAYPIKHIILPFCFSIQDLNESYRKPYQEGYDQAMQDFLEKACYYLKSTLQEDDETNDFIVQQFKKYMQDE